MGPPVTLFTEPWRPCTRTKRRRQCRLPSTTLFARSTALIRRSTANSAPRSACASRRSKGTRRARCRTSQRVAQRAYARAGRQRSPRAPRHQDGEDRNRRDCRRWGGGIFALVACWVMRPTVLLYGACDGGRRTRRRGGNQEAAATRHPKHRFHRTRCEDIDRRQIEIHRRGLQICAPQADHNIIPGGAPVDAGGGGCRRVDRSSICARHGTSGAGVCVSI